MKIRNKIIALIISLIAIPTFALAKDGPYAGVKASNVKLDYSTVEGLNLNNVYDRNIRAYDYHIGYNTGNWFGEFGYVDSQKGNRNLLNVTDGVYTLSVDTAVDFKGYRLGGGYNFKPSKEISLRPFANIYRLDVSAEISGTVTGGGNTIKAAWKTSGNDTMIDAGLGLAYAFNDNVAIEASYSQSFKEIEDTNKIEMLSISLKYNF
jgi:hypothetical protein